MGTDTMNYVMGGLKTAAGAAATVLGQPEIGIPLATSGAGQLAGQGAGGNTGAGIGSSVGGLVGGGAAGLGGSGFAMPGAAGTPTASQMTPSLPSYINPSQIIGVSTSQAQPQAAQPGAFNQAMGLANNLAPAAQQFMNRQQQPQAQPQQAPPLPSPRPMPQQQSPQPGIGTMQPNPAVGTAGALKPPSNQLAALLGLGPFNG